MTAALLVKRMPWGAPRKVPQRMAECCPEKANFAHGLCRECHGARLAEARTIKGQLRAARAGLSHAVEVQQYFAQTAARLPRPTVEQDRALELATEWQNRIDLIASEIVALEKILGRDRRAQRAANGSEEDPIEK